MADCSGMGCGTQACHKERRASAAVSAEGKAHYAKFVVALKEIIRLMAEIDDAIPGWPLM